MRQLFFSPVLGSHSYLIQLITGLVLFLAIPGWGQDIIWIRTYGGPYADHGARLCKTSDGGYVMVGITESFGSSRQIYLVKTDARGDTLWTRTFGGAGQDIGNSVQQTSDGGYIIAGFTGSFGLAFQVYLIKTDSRGNAVWGRTYGGSDVEDGITVQQTSDSGYIVVGSTYSYGAGGRDLYLIKTDLFGQMQWSRTYGGVRDDAGWWVDLTPDGGYIITGYTESFAPHRWVYLLKTNCEGDTLWTKALNPSGSYWSWGYVLQRTLDSGYIITGPCVTEPEPGHVYDSFLIKTDAQGDTIWTRTYDRGDFDWAGSVRQTYDGGYIVAGLTQTYKSGSGAHPPYEDRRLPAHIGMTETYRSGSGDHMYVIKTDSEGDTLWTRDFGVGSSSDVQQIPDSNYVICGEISTPYASRDLCLLKISCSPLPTLRGDATGDGVINASDVVYLVNYVLRGGPTPEPLKAGDANCDLWIDLEDVIYLIRYLFLGGPEPGLGCE
jgi:hypothetical protein